MPARSPSSAIATRGSIGRRARSRRSWSCPRVRSGTARGMRPGLRNTRSSRGAAARAAVTPPGAEASADRDRPCRRRRTDALAGLERWRARHPEAAAHLKRCRRARRRDARKVPARGRASASTCSTSRLRSGPPRSRSIRTALRTATPMQPAARRAEDLLELVRRRDLELIVAAVARLLVGAPPRENRRVTEARPLQVVVLDLAHALDAQRLPRQILAGAPAALAARHARRRRQPPVPPSPATGAGPSRCRATARARSASSSARAIVNADVTPTWCSLPASS